VKGRVAIVTGASDGIGKEVARGLAARGARVVLACRNAERGEAARADIVATTGNPAVDVRLVDFSRPPSIRAFAAAFAAEHPALHVLVNNAGTWSPQRRTTEEGFELTWATNMLGYFLTTTLLLDLLRRGAPARVVVVASELARDLDLDDLAFTRRPYDGVTAYAQSKQANRMFTWALARRLAESGVTANAMHPGGVATGIFRKGGGLGGRLVDAASRLFGRSPARGADTAVWLAADAEVEGRSGLFFKDRRERSCRFRGEREEERLWARCAAMTEAAGG
jgi:NAD(P)-dependent dehydrogenase (short-subunit alcohol dehydrogenase family)